ncbi:hypothetical protein [Amycolatopsis sp. NPDC004625]|uniref:hypothetical protein n=1 Tax=Amycolatopsis sp. NPDC004625 TaxID=3154670 RepID=UPI0033A9BC46
MPDTAQQPEARDLTGATAYAGVPDKGDRWYILKESDTVLYQRSDGTFAPERDKDGRRVQIVTAATLHRATQTWREVPINP